MLRVNLVERFQDPDAGVVYTRPELVRFTLDLCGYVVGRETLPEVRVLDVGCGIGQFIGEAVGRLAAHCKQEGLRFSEFRAALERSVMGIEVDSRTRQLALAEVRRAIAKVYPHTRLRQWMESIVVEGDFLEWHCDRPFDLIVGNVPYVRHDQIPKLDRKMSRESLADRFKTFRGRCDYSVPFLERITELIGVNGTVGVVTSNRFTQAQYGLELRKLLAGFSSTHVLNEFDFSEVSPFEGEVTAYASLFELTPRGGRKSRYTRILSMEQHFLNDLVAAKGVASRTSRGYFGWSRGSFPRGGEPWSPLPRRVTDILRRLERNLPTLAEGGFAIKKGPATGADEVFTGTRQHFGFRSKAARDTLLPLEPRTRGTNRWLLNLRSSATGRLRSLSSLPQEVREYLYRHRGTLAGRHVVKVQRRPWWDSIDAYTPSILQSPKVLVRDLSRGASILHDSGKFFPLHPTVYVAGEHRELEVLAEYLRSEVVDLYRLWKAPPLRGRALRASAKVLRGLPYPERGFGSQFDSDECFRDALSICDDDVLRIKAVHELIFGTAWFLKHLL